MNSFWRASFAAMLLGVMVAASACGGSGTKNEPKAADQPQARQVTIRLGTWDSGDGVKAHQEIIDAFQKANPNIKVQLESVPDDYGTKLLTQMAAGTAPDVFQIGDGDVGMFVNKGVVEDLSSYGIDKSIYYPNVYDVGVVNGKPYFLTKDYSPLAVYYNKDLFDKAGVAYPKPGWTWDDFLAAAKALNHPDQKQWGVDLTGSWTRALEPWIFQNNGKVISADGKQYEGAINSKETVDAVKFFIAMYREAKVAPTAADKESFKNIDLFATGKVAMSITGRWPLDGYKANSSLKFGVVGLPKKQQAANVLCWAGFGVNAKSANKQEAVQFLKYLAGPEGAKVFAKWAIPAVQSVADQTGFTKDEYNKVFVDELNTVKPFGAKYNYLYGQSGEKFLGPALDELLLKGGDVKAKLDQVAKDADKELKDLSSK